jgi:hypothetical protein
VRGSTSRTSGRLTRDEAWRLIIRWAMPLALAVVTWLSFARGAEGWLLTGALVAIATVAAMARPQTFVALTVAAIIGPLVFHMTPQYRESWGVIELGFTVGDVFLYAMLAALVLRSLRPSAGRRDERVVVMTAALLGVWLLISALRGMPQFGISALGEMRTFYSILILPVYMGEFWDPGNGPDRSLRFLALLAVIPVMLLPVVGAMKGWAFGATSRLYDARSGSSPWRHLDAGVDSASVHGGRARSYHLGWSSFGVVGGCDRPSWHVRGSRCPSLGAAPCGRMARGCWPDPGSGPQRLRLLAWLVLGGQGCRVLRPG